MYKESLYFLAIIPPKNICEEVYTYKQIAFEKFNSRASLNSPAHITLHMPFKWKNKKEDLLIEKLSEFSFTNFPFSIELNDFNSFTPRVIFINVKESEQLNTLQKNLIRHMRKELNILNADYKGRPFHPHMTVAFRDLKKSIFRETEAFFAKEKYHRKFEASQFCLLKHDGKVWHEYKYF